MGREVRMVPADWVHPRYTADHPDAIEHPRWIGNYIPMLQFDFQSSYEDWQNTDLPEWEEGKLLWDNGYVWARPRGSHWNDPEKLIPIDEFVADWNLNRESYQPEVVNADYDWWAGEKPEAPNPNDYMPDWPDEQRTHFMMYESTSEGTPISPAFATPEELARWLADTGASSFADFTATYEQWLNTIREGSAPSAIISNGTIKSGVEGITE